MHIRMWKYFNTTFIFSICLTCSLNIQAFGSKLTPAGAAFLKRYSKNVLFVATGTKQVYKVNEYSIPLHHLTPQLDFAIFGDIKLKSDDGNIKFDEASLYPIINYNFNSHWTWISLFELSESNGKGSSSSVQYAQLNWLAPENLTLIGGLFLSPLGKFSNSLYLPWINKLPSEPVGFDSNEASPREDFGFQLQGLIPTNFINKINYSIFVASSPYVHTDNGELTSITTNGSPFGRGGHKMLGARIGFFLFPFFEAGFSAAIGSVELFNNGIKINSSRGYNVLGTDLNYSHDNIDLRVEYIQQLITAKNSSVIANSGKWKAIYSQAAYKFNPSPWEVIMRWGYFSSAERAENQHQVAMGIDYWFTPTKVAKIYYAINRGRSGMPANSNQVLAEVVFNI